MNDPDASARSPHVCGRLSSVIAAALICSAAGLATLASDSPAAGKSVRGRLTPGAPAAVVARVIVLKENGQLHLTSSHGTTLDEEGRATGTYNCSIVVHLTILSATRVTTTFKVRPNGGTITGGGAARYAAEGENGYFGGTIALTHGTGTYAHASGAAIGISGKISRESFNLTVHVHGSIRI